MKTPRTKRASLARERLKSSGCGANAKRSRFMKKTDEEILIEILVLAEKTESFCPERLMNRACSRLFEEAYRRFETWDVIVDRCIELSNTQNLIGKPLKTPKEVVLEIMRLETGGMPFHERGVLQTHPELHAAAVMFYGSWNRVLCIVGLKSHDELRDVTG